MRLVVRALVGAMAMAMVSVGAAQATTGSPPVTVNDAITITAGHSAEPDVLANDSDPDGDPLALCRLGRVPGGIDAEIFQDQLMVFALKPGTYTVTYYACDYSYLTPGTLTVTVKAPPPLFAKVVKGKWPGTIRVFNNGKFGFQFLWGSYKKRHADGRISVPAHTSVRVRVRRVSIVWIAVNERKGAFKAGITRGIALPKGAHALPPGAPPTALRTMPPRWIIQR